MLRHLAICAVALASFGCTTGAGEWPVQTMTPALTPPAVGSIGVISSEAEILFASGMAGEKDRWGFAARELYVVGADGRGLTRITHSGFAHNHFSISPNRRWIFTNRYSRGDTTKDGREDYRDFKELWLIDLENRTERRVLEGIDGGYGGVGWSPDSHYVHFGIRTVRGLDIMRWRVAGGTPEVITADIQKLLNMPGEEYSVSDIDISPDGKWAVMLYSNGNRDDPEVQKTRKTRVALFKLDGSEARIVTDGGPMKAGVYGMWPAGDFDPDFSPDGKSISFQRATDAAILPKRNVSSSDIMRQDLDGGNLARISIEGNKLQNGISSWGGPRCEIVYAIWSDDRPTKIEVVKPDGSNRRQLPLPGEGSHVQWLPVKDELGACK